MKGASISNSIQSITSITKQNKFKHISMYQTLVPPNNHRQLSLWNTYLKAEDALYTYKFDSF